VRNTREKKRGAALRRRRFQPTERYRALQVPDTSLIEETWNVSPDIPDIPDCPDVVPCAPVLPAPVLPAPVPAPVDAPPPMPEWPLIEPPDELSNEPRTSTRWFRYRDQFELLFPVAMRRTVDAPDVPAVAPDVPAPAPAPVEPAPVALPVALPVLLPVLLLDDPDPPPLKDTSVRMNPEPVELDDEPVRD
jgi:hypothetical protein